MAQTDARPGFRLPWNSERSNGEQPETDTDETAQADGVDTTDETTAIAIDAVPEWPTMSDTTVTAESADAPAADAPAADAPAADAPEPTEASAPVVEPAKRRPSKFMEDLSKAMQVAAEEARTRTLGQFEADAKGHIENIQGRLTTETADLRRKADDDVAAHREWSKLEIARVREETEGRISARKSLLESEIALHAVQIEREVQIVQGRVSEFEAEMAAFFERLLAEDDPTRIATMAERLPEPPPFDTVTESAVATLQDAPADEAVTDEVMTNETPAETASVDTESVTVLDGDAATVADNVEGQAVPDGFEMDREAAFAAVQAAAEAAASAEVATDAAERAEAVAEITMGIGSGRDDDPENENAPAPDFGAAEVEAATSVEGEAEAAEGEEITEIGDDDLAARLAGLVPGKTTSKVHSTDATSTQVVVVGLVSVASIASFKRHLGRVSGVQSVGVSSGPDGEFMFAVHHSADVVMRDAIPSLPSFQARVTNTADGVLNVTAHDPESDH